jgi:hypothetical protein
MVSSQKRFSSPLVIMDRVLKDNGYLNGNWILFEHDDKTKKNHHNFSDGIVAEGANDLKVIVTDNVGNSTTFETFFRSQNKYNTYTA